MPRPNTSPEAYIAHLEAKGVEFTVGPRAGMPDAPPATVVAGRPSKYRNRKTEIDGRTFDSKKEANRYLDLREQQRAGVINQLYCQKEFDLVVNGVIVCQYVADFVYMRDGKMVIEDVKSEVTRKLPVYRLKRKILAANGITINEV